jgi:hypothetical protein
MQSWKRALGYGLLVWLIPFAIAFSAFALKESWRSLFESLMAASLCLVVVTLSLLYFRRPVFASTSEGLKLGLLWLAISVAIDLPLMLSPPINYTPEEYLADIGLTYAMIPMITVGIAVAASWQRTREHVANKPG